MYTHIAKDPIFTPVLSFIPRFREQINNGTMRGKHFAISLGTDQTPKAITIKIPGTDHSCTCFTEFDWRVIHAWKYMQYFKGSGKKFFRENSRKQAKLLANLMREGLSLENCILTAQGSTSPINKWTVGKNRICRKYQKGRLVPTADAPEYIKKQILNMSMTHDMNMRYRLIWIEGKSSGRNHYKDNSLFYDNLREEQERTGKHIISTDDSFGTGTSASIEYWAMKAAGIDMSKVHFCALICERQRLTKKVIKSLGKDKVVEIMKIKVQADLDKKRKRQDKNSPDYLTFTD